MGDPNCFIANPDVVLREEDDDGALLFNPDTNHLQVVNSTGAYLWRLCDGRRGFGDLCDLLSEEFDGLPEDRALVEEQIRAFFDDLAEKGFVGTVQESRDAP